jgi:serine/threonine-protein kinase
VLVVAVCVLLSYAESAEGDTISIRNDSFAAIAYSPATGTYGLAYNYSSRESAEKAALEDCGEQDAQITCWVKKGFCALALGNDKSCWGVGWSYGNGASTDKARKFALDDCRKRTTGAHIEAYLSSDGQVVWKRTLDADGNGQIWVSPDTFGAIAYSPATGTYGLACNRLGRESAEKDALGNCGAKDARIVCWVNRGFCALALCSDKMQWGVGWSESDSAKAKEAALADCRNKTSVAPHIEVSMSSDGQILWERAKHTTIILPSGEVILPSGERIPLPAR